MTYTHFAAVWFGLLCALCAYGVERLTERREYVTAGVIAVIVAANVGYLWTLGAWGQAIGVPIAAWFGTSTVIEIAQQIDAYRLRRPRR